MKITLVGSYPPPYGGISVHIKKLKKRLEIEGNEVEVIDISTPKPTTKVGNVYYYNRGNKITSLVKGLIHLISSKSGIVHFHTSAFGNFLYIGPFMLLFTFNKKQVVTIHSGSFIKQVSNFNTIKRNITKLILMKMDHIIVVNNEQFVYLNESLRIDSNKLSVFPAFIPEDISYDDINPMLKKKMNEFKLKYKKVIITSGYKVDYYGHHHTLNALKGIPQDIATIFCFYNKFEEDYSKKIDTLKKVNPHAYFLNNLSPNEFSFLLSNSNIYVRSTDRDGDAVAIREALYYGLNVIATDCVRRPKGTKLFKFGDYKELSKLLMMSIDSNDNTNENMKSIEYGFTENYSELLYKL